MFKKKLKSYKKRLKSSRLFLFSKNYKENKKYVKDNIKAYGKEQGREVKELIEGRQNLVKFFNDTSSLFQDYFIPTNNNDNRPKILRPRQLTIIAFALIFLKIALAGYVLSVYQERAEMSTDTVNQILILTNESRVANGAKPVLLNKYLNQAAQAKAEDMLIHNYFAHTSPDGRKPWNFINRTLFPYLLVGENLAMHFISGSDAHAALMASPGHKKNIINPKYTDVGLYVLEGRMNGQDTKILVQMFAYRLLPDIVEAQVEPSKSEEVAKVDTISTVEKPQNLNEPKLSEDKTIEEVDEPQLVVSSDKAEETEGNTQVLGDEQTPKTDEAAKIETENEETNNEELVVGQEITETVELEEGMFGGSLVDNSSNLIATATIANLESEYILAQAPVTVTRQDAGIDRAAKAMSISKLIYASLLVVLILLLLINILVRVTKQHKSIIIHTILLLILVSALLLFDFGFMERVENASANIILF